MASNDDETVLDMAKRAALSPMLQVDDFRPLSASVRVQVGARSHPGRSSLHNNDHYLVLQLARSQETLATSLGEADVPPKFEEYGYAMLVADGLGEGGSGSVASRVALSTIGHLALHCGKWNLRVDPRTAVDIVERTEWFYTRADAAVTAHRLTNMPLSGMATALTAAYSAGDDLFIAHVGHSRAYLFRDGGLIQLTRDQTIKPRPDDPRAPALPEARAQDLGHILTDAIGAGGGPPSVEIEHFRLMNGDGVLLCTNGLTDVLDDTRIADVLALRRQPAEQCAILADLAAQQGGKDSITVVLAQYQVPRD